MSKLDIKKVVLCLSLKSLTNKNIKQIFLRADPVESIRPWSLMTGVIFFHLVMKTECWVEFLIYQTRTHM